MPLLIVEFGCSVEQPCLIVFIYYHTFSCLSIGSVGIFGWNFRLEFLDSSEPRFKKKITRTHNA